jgi:hypothetical protein
VVGPIVADHVEGRVTARTGADEAPRQPRQTGAQMTAQRGGRCSKALGKNSCGAASRPQA